MISSLERPNGPRPSLRQALADFGPIRSANGDTNVAPIRTRPSASFLRNHDIVSGASERPETEPAPSSGRLRPDQIGERGHKRRTYPHSSIRLLLEEP